MIFVETVGVKIITFIDDVTLHVLLLVEPFCLASYPSAFHSVMFNPVEPRLLATANSKEGVGLWDIRKPRRSVWCFFSLLLFDPVFKIDLLLIPAGTLLFRTKAIK